MMMRSICRIEIKQFTEGITVTVAVVVITDATVVRDINVNTIVFYVVFEAASSRIGLFSCDSVEISSDRIASALYY